MWQFAASAVDAAGAVFRFAPFRWARAFETKTTFQPVQWV